MPASINDITAEAVKSLLSYDPETGLLTWKLDRGKKIKAGSPAGWLENDGSIRIQIFGRSYFAHRLAWVIMTGVWPVDLIDHRDLNASNNRWTNLREANDSQNNHNKITVNKTGARGVTRRGNRFIARIRMNGKTVRLGTRGTIEEAATLYEAAALSYYGEFAIKRA